MPRKNAQSFHRARQQWTKRLENSTGDYVIALSKHLVQIGLWERLIAYEIITHHQGALDALTPQDIVRLGRGMQSWGEVDCFAGYIAGPAWRQGNLTDRTVHSWARSRDRWWRRAALVSTVPLSRSAQECRGNVNRTIGICRMLVQDRDDMVVKAMSWALRELGKRHPHTVRSFLEHHERQLAARVKREVANKLRTGLKNPHRAKKGQ